MEGIKEFLESSTIHGLAHISTNRGLVRFLWLFVVLIGFSGAGILIHQSFSSWAGSPISNTIETVPISDLDFPNVTVCPPKKSFTSLNPDLVMSKNMTFDLDKRKEVANSIVDTVFFANYEPKYREFLQYRGQQKLMDLYSGVSKMNLPRQHTAPPNGVTFRKYNHDTEALSGSISTPYFRQPFNNNTFELTLLMHAFIYVPDKIAKGSKIVLDFEYDMEQISHNEYFRMKQYDQNKNGVFTAETQTTTWSNSNWNGGSIRKEYYVGESTNGKT